MNPYRDPPNQFPRAHELAPIRLCLLALVRAMTFGVSSFAGGAALTIAALLGEDYHGASSKTGAPITDAIAAGTN